MSLMDLILPILVSSVALFFASFLSWMVLPIHFSDWRKSTKDDELVDSVRNLGLETGSYMFPGWATPEEMKSEEYAKKWEDGPVGVMTVFPKVSMGRNLGLTFTYFLVVSACLGYLGTMALNSESSFLEVFRFLSTAGLMTFLSGILSHAIWFHNRVVGHVIESVAYAAIVGGVFGAMWP